MPGIADLVNVTAVAAQGPAGDSGADWVTIVLVPLLVAGIPATIGVLVSRSDRRDARLAAQQAQRSNEEIEKLRLLERRVSERKAQAYNDYLPAFAKLFEGSKTNKSAAETTKESSALLRASNKFWHESLMYSSDDVQRSFARAIQSAFNDAPPVISMRLYGELVIAMRLDMWADASDLTSMDVWAPKIKDMLKHEYLPGLTMQEASTIAFSDLCERVGWPCPWKGTPLEHRHGEESRLVPPAQTRSPE